jgi:hypothetical protein
MTEGNEMERLERIAQKVDEEGEAAVSERERVVLGRMRELRDVLRVGGPAKTSKGFADRVVAMMEEAREAQKVVQLRARRDRVFVFSQAASLALLVGAYVTLLAMTRVERVGERWSEGATASGARPDAGPSASNDRPAATVFPALDPMPTGEVVVADGLSPDSLPQLAAAIEFPAAPSPTLLPRRHRSG